MQEKDYVKLSLEKYNELYDKAKKYDEYHIAQEDLEKLRKSLIGIAEEQSSITKEDNTYYDVELLRDHNNIPAGAKGKLLEHDSINPWVNWDNHYICCYSKRIEGVLYDNVYAVNKEDLKFINNKEEN